VLRKMVSEKIVIILIVVAILLSIISIVVTISTVNTKLVPNVALGSAAASSGTANGGQVGITLIPPTG
jgi:hypothetical protein